MSGDPPLTEYSLSIMDDDYDGSMELTIPDDVWCSDCDCMKSQEDFKKVLFVAGNHEYYGKFDVAQSKDQLRIEVRPNVTLLHNHSLEYKGVQFIFSTLFNINITSI